MNYSEICRIYFSLRLKALMNEHFLILAVSVPISLHSHVSSVPIFNGLNFYDWFEQVQFHLGVLDLDLALQVEKPAAITILAMLKRSHIIRIGKD